MPKPRGHALKTACVKDALRTQWESVWRLKMVWLKPNCKNTSNQNLIPYLKIPFDSVEPEFGKVAMCNSSLIGNYSIAEMQLDSVRCLLCAFPLTLDCLLCLTRKLCKRMGRAALCLFMCGGANVRGAGIKWFRDICHYKTNQILIMDDLSHIHCCLMW